MKVSLAANPADVHRATDAVLMALDRNANSFPHIVTIATSNFTGALDEAFLSRVDLSLEVPLPNAEAGAKIVRETLLGFADAYAALGRLAEAKEIEKLGGQLVGLDGRQIRKLITESMAMRRDVVIDPSSLTIVDLAGAIKRMKAELPEEEDAHAAA